MKKRKKGKPFELNHWVQKWESAVWWTGSHVVDRQSHGGQAATWWNRKASEKSKKTQRVKEGHVQVQAVIRKEKKSYTNLSLCSERQGYQVSGKKRGIISLKG